MAVEKAKLLCSFGGDFILHGGKAVYIGGKTRLVSIDRSTSFQSLLAKMAQLCDADPSVVDVKFQLPDESLDSRLISVETDDDVRNMMEEFDSNRKIPIFLFIDKTRNTEEEEDEEEEADVDVEDLGVDDIAEAHFGTGPSLVESLMVPDGTESFSEPDFFTNEDSLTIHNEPDNTSMRRQYTRHSAIGPSMTGETFRRDSQSLVVGQEYEDVQTFRNALTSAAIAAKFELHMIRSDQRRVTARCAAEGCIWRVHASKLPQRCTFRIRTLTPEHTCVRSDEAGHRQATAKWIASCIRDKLRENRNYKPREILNDIHREYGVRITYKRAFLGREKALEELRAEPSKDSIESFYDPVIESDHAEAQRWGEIDDPPRKKRIYRSRQLKEVRPLHCTQCNQIGHNRRTCTLPELLQD